MERNEIREHSPHFADAHAGYDRSESLLRESCDFQLIRQLVELHDQRIRERHTVALAFLSALPAPFAGKTDHIDTRQPPRLPQILHVAIDLGGEGCKRS